MSRSIFLTISFLIFIFIGTANGAHILEPIDTEIAATTPRGRMFGQLVYSLLEPGKHGSHNISAISIEFEAGIGESTQLNLEAENMFQDESGEAEEKGIEEISIGIKHRFQDETETLPDSAFEVEFVPSSGFGIDGRSILAALILSKNINPQLLLHLNLGYGIRTEVNSNGSETTTDRGGVGIINITPIYKAIPDKLMLMTEFNALIDTGEDVTEVTLSPEVIFVMQTATFLKMQNIAFKFGFPIGVTSDTPDIGVKFGISKLF